MGYIGNTVVTIDAILTTKGKELLSKGASNFNITQFALADDEIDYKLWNPDHNLGTAYYGEMIENLPLIEATPDERQTMKHKLISLGKSTIRIPMVSVGQTNIVLESGGQSYTITPTTINYENANATYGYTAILSNSDVATIRPTPGYELNIDNLPTTSITGETDTLNQSVTVMGKRFDIIAKPQYQSDATATITIVGNETGGQVFLNLTVKKQNQIIGA